MAIIENETAFVASTATSIGLSKIFSVTATSPNPAYLVLTALDRNEYTAGEAGATGSFAGNGQTLNLSPIEADGRGAGIVFTLLPNGRYYNSTYGYFDQLTYNSSGSLGEVTNLSLFGTNDLSQVNGYTSSAFDIMQSDPGGYLGSATIVTEANATDTVPTQATPNSLAAVAEGFIGKSWNLDGCWVLASTIAADAGASLPVQSTLIGQAGQANGEWIVAYNGPAGQSGNWQSMVQAGEIVVIGTPDGGGHITTCVSGSGSSAMVVEFISFFILLGQILNPANDGSSDDIVVSAPHLASQEWAGVQANSVVIYELDTPIVSAQTSADSLTCNTTQALGSLFSAIDPANKVITEWQVYDTETSDALVSNGVDCQAHSAGSALTVTSLSGLSLLAGSTPGTDTLEVRAYNGSYWGDWTSLSVAVTAPPSPPVLRSRITAQTWVGSRYISFALPDNMFSDPQGQTLSHSATMANGQALPGWLSFNPLTETFSGYAPPSAQTLNISVKATDTSGLSATDTFSATVVGIPVLANATPNQTWTEGKSISLVLPANTFVDPQGQTLVYSAQQIAPNGLGQALPSWLTFNPATRTLSGIAPSTAQNLTIEVEVRNSSGLFWYDDFTTTVKPALAVAKSAAEPILTSDLSDLSVPNAAPGQPGSPGLSVFNATTGQSTSPVVQSYTGSVAGLTEQLINIASDGLNITASTPGWFIHSGSGNDALAASSGTNVLDGGTGSNFLTGGSGTDTFFVDDRGPLADIWDTISNFHAGDGATIWGVTPADFNLAWADGQGAAGYTGLTLHAAAAGEPTASLTLAGFTSSDLSNGRLSISYGTSGGNAYMYVHANQ